MISKWLFILSTYKTKSIGCIETKAPIFIKLYQLGETMYHLQPVFVIFVYIRKNYKKVFNQIKLSNYGGDLVSPNEKFVVLAFMKLKIYSEEQNFS